jgi:hypothetical protein
VTSTWPPLRPGKRDRPNRRLDTGSSDERLGAIALSGDASKPRRFPLRHGSRCALRGHLVKERAADALGAGPGPDGAAPGPPPMLPETVDLAPESAGRSSLRLLVFNLDRSAAIALYPRGGWPQGLNPSGVLRTALTASLLSPRVPANRANRTHLRKGDSP